MRVFETVVYARDLGAVAEFYGTTLGLRLVDGPDELGMAFRLDDDAMLLIFDPDRSSMPGRPAPPHGADGAGHVAFLVEPAEFDRLRDRLRRARVAIEQERDGGDGGRAVYVRDPEGNSVELRDGDPWPR